MVVVVCGRVLGKLVSSTKGYMIGCKEGSM